MDPNVYMAYLCFLDNDTPAYNHFKVWRQTKAPGMIGFSMHLGDTAWQMKHKARISYIYELEQAWNKFSAEEFIKFLQRHGFKR